MKYLHTLNKGKVQVTKSQGNKYIPYFFTDRKELSLPECIGRNEGSIWVGGRGERWRGHENFRYSDLQACAGFEVRLLVF